MTVRIKQALQFRLKLDHAQAHLFTVPLTVFIISRLVVIIGTIIPVLFDSGDFVLSYLRFPHLNPYIHWDSTWYISIIESGYHYIPGERSSIAFFPAYPMLVKTLAPLFAGNIMVTGIVISNVCFLGALIFLYRLALLDLDRETAARAVFYTASFPTAFFFSIFYTESLFLFASVVAFYYARKRIWSVAVLAAIVCSMTRLPGIVVCGMLDFEWLYSHGWKFENFWHGEMWKRLRYALRQDLPNLLLIIFSPLGLAVYFFYITVTFGSITTFFEAQATWGSITNPIVVFARDILETIVGIYTWGYVANGVLPFYILLESTAFLIFTLMSVAMWRRKQWKIYAVYTAISVLIPMMTRSKSMLRYGVVLFPVFMLLASDASSPREDRVIRVTFLVLLGVATALYVEGYWLG